MNRELAERSLHVTSDGLSLYVDDRCHLAVAQPARRQQRDPSFLAGQRGHRIPPWASGRWCRTDHRLEVAPDPTKLIVGLLDGAVHGLDPELERIKHPCQSC